MSTNYEWQKQQVNDRIQGALQDASAHRISRRGVRQGFAGSLVFKIVLLLGVGFFIISLLLAGCTPVDSALAVDTDAQAAAQPGASTSWTMADRIRFQDRLWEQALAAGEIKPDSPWTMADRIRFQDQLDRR